MIILVQHLRVQSTIDAKKDDSVFSGFRVQLTDLSETVFLVQVLRGLVVVLVQNRWGDSRSLPCKLKASFQASHSPISAFSGNNLCGQLTWYICFCFDQQSAPWKVISQNVFINKFDKNCRLVAYYYQYKY